MTLLVLSVPVAEDCSKKRRVTLFGPRYTLRQLGCTVRRNLAQLCSTERRMYKVCTIQRSGRMDTRRIDTAADEDKSPGTRCVRRTTVALKLFVRGSRFDNIYPGPRS